MAGPDKRTIISSKRARNKRKKAQRSTAKALAQLDADHSGELTPTDASSGDEAAAQANETRPSAIAKALVHADEDEGEEEEVEDDDDELVFVCRPMMHDFCVEYVSAAPSLLMAGSTVPSAWADLKPFTVRIPAFRETRDGYTTYSIVVTTSGNWRRQFQVERRYSEFVAFVTTLEEYLHSPEYKQLREKLLELEQGQHQADESSGNQVQSFHWELPPKTWFRMTQATALEERRSKLEASLQKLLAHEPRVICQIPLVRDFLTLDIFGAQVVEEKLQRV